MREHVVFFIQSLFDSASSATMTRAISRLSRLEFLVAIRARASHCWHNPDRARSSRENSVKSLPSQKLSLSLTRKPKSISLVGHYLSGQEQFVHFEAKPRNLESYWVFAGLYFPGYH